MPKQYIDNYLGSHKSKDRLVVGEMEILDEPTFTICGKEFCGIKSLKWLEDAVKEKLAREQRGN